MTQPQREAERQCYGGSSSSNRH